MKSLPPAEGRELLSSVQFTGALKIVGNSCWVGPQYSLSPSETEGSVPPNLSAPPQPVKFQSRFLVEKTRSFYLSYLLILKCEYLSKILIHIKIV